MSLPSCLTRRSLSLRRLGRRGPEAPPAPKYRVPVRRFGVARSGSLILYDRSCGGTSTTSARRRRCCCCRARARRSLRCFRRRPRPCSSSSGDSQMRRRSVFVKRVLVVSRVGRKQVRGVVAIRVVGLDVRPSDTFPCRTEVERHRQALAPNVKFGRPGRRFPDLVDEVTPYDTVRDTAGTGSLAEVAELRIEPGKRAGKRPVIGWHPYGVDLDAILPSMSPPLSENVRTIPVFGSGRWRCVSRLVYSV